MAEVSRAVRRFDLGVRYEVLVGDLIAWSRFVTFGSSLANKPGGLDFRDAEEEQRDVYDRLIQMKERDAAAYAQAREDLIRKK